MLTVVSVEVPLKVTCWPTLSVVLDAAQLKAPAVLVAYTLDKEVFVALPLTVIACPTAKLVPLV